MAKRWSKEEHSILNAYVKDNVKIDVVLKLLPNRTHWALKRQAQLLGYGVKTIENIEYFTKDKGTRVRTVKKKRITEDKATKKIVGKNRVAATTLKPTTAERTNQNISASIISENDNNFTSFCQKLHELLYDKTLQITCITTKYKDLSITMRKEAS